MVDLLLMVNFFQGSHFQAGELTFSVTSQMEKVDPSLMRGMTFVAVGLITKVNEVLGNSDLKGWFSRI